MVSIEKDLLPIIQNEYYDFFERKNKFENKSTSFIAIVALILATSWPIFFQVYDNVALIELIRKIFLIIEISITYWSLLVIGFSLTVVYPRKIKKIDKDEVILDGFNNGEEQFYKKRLSTYISMINFNSPILTKIAFYNNIAGLFLIFALSIFFIQVVFYFFYKCIK
jgi:hypothetical protein